MPINREQNCFIENMFEVCGCFEKPSRWYEICHVCCWTWGGGYNCDKSIVVAAPVNQSEPQTFAIIVESMNQSNFGSFSRV